MVKADTERKEKPHTGACLLGFALPCCAGLLVYIDCLVPSSQDCRAGVESATSWQSIIIPTKACCSGLLCAEHEQQSIISSWEEWSRH